MEFDIIYIKKHVVRSERIDELGKDFSALGSNSRSSMSLVVDVKITVLQKEK